MKPNREKTEHEPAPPWPFILIVIIVVAFMLYILTNTGITPTGPNPTQCIFPVGISCIRYKLHVNTSELDLDVGQGTGLTVNITGVVCIQNESLDLSKVGINNYADSPIIITHGNHTFISQSGTSHAVKCTNAAGNIPSDTTLGAWYYGRIYINYTELETNRTKITVGMLYERYEA